MNDQSEIFASIGGIKPIDGDDFAPVSQEEIESIEAKLENQLPSDYRHFLTTYGSSILNELVEFSPIMRLPPSISTTGNGHVAIFYGTRSNIDDAYSLARRIEFFRGRLPLNLIPIADTGGGNQILLGIKGRELGEVFYWDQSNEQLDEEDYLEDFGVPRPDEAMFQNVHLIASSFSDFLSRLAISKGH